MKQLTILALLILGSAAAQAGDYKCTNATQSLTIHTLPFSKVDEYTHAVVTVTNTPQGDVSYNGTALNPGGLVDYNLLGERGEKATLQISVVQHHGGRCGRCAGGDSFDFSYTYAKLTTMANVYDFTCN